MAEWIMAHPWMTFFLAALTLMFLEGAVANVCKAIIVWRLGKLPEPKEEKEEENDGH